MDFAALQVFKAVVDEGGVIPAARKLHRVQSNVTTRIQQLEASLGARLFVREKRRLHLSPQGELFLGYVEEMLALSERARAAVHEGAPQGVLRLGTLESTAASRLPALLSHYHAQYPAVKVELSTGTTDALVAAVTARRVQAAFVADFAPADALESVPVFREDLVAIAPHSHSPIRRARDVRSDTLISFPSGCAYRRRFHAWLESDGVTPDRVMELGSYHAIIACVAAGSGIGVVPRSVLDSMPGAALPRIKKHPSRNSTKPKTMKSSLAGSVASYPLGPRGMRIVTSLVWRKGGPSPALRVLLEMLGKP